MKKPKLLLLDSDVIIHCHRIGVWESLKTKYSIHVTSIVVDEVTYAKIPLGSIRVDLQAQADKGELTIVESTPEEMANITNQFTDSFAQGLDDGETEGIAVVAKGELEDCKFCTGDTNGLLALGMLSLGSLSISLEEVLIHVGLLPKAPDKLRPHLCQTNRETQIKNGSIRKITGESMKQA